MSSDEEQVGLVYFWWIWLRIFVRKNVFERFYNFRARRPHRSFRLTRRRDYVRPLKIAGYWSLAKSVLLFIMNNRNRSIFLKIILIASIVNFVVVGLLDQAFISSLQSVVDLTNGGLFSGGWGEIGKAGLIVLSTFSTGGLVRNPNELQQATMFIIVLFVWLAVSQICRSIMAGRRNIYLRDILYTCGAPIIPLAIVSIVILVQMIPAFVGVIVFSAARVTEFAGVGVERLVFASLVFLLISLSIYWSIGSVFAMIILTNQSNGRVIYPFQALRISGDMISQRRLSIFLRIMFCFFVIMMVWMVILIPSILLMNWLGSSLEFIKSVPVIQVIMVLLTNASFVYLACYIYTLYRKILDNDRKI